MAPGAWRIVGTSRGQLLCLVTVSIFPAGRASAVWDQGCLWLVAAAE